MVQIGKDVERMTAGNVDDVLKAAGLDWQVDQRPLYLGEEVNAWDEDGVTRRFIPTNQQIVSHRANVRSDTGETLAVVGKGYEVFQNRELAELVLAVTEQSETKLVQAGSLDGGRDVFFLLESGGFTLPNADKVKLYHFFGNNHAGLRSINVVPTSHRVFCSNILNAIVADSAKRGLRIWHTKNLRQRLEQALIALKVSSESALDFQRRCEYLSQRWLTAGQVKDYFDSVYDAEYGPKPKLDEFSTKGDKQRLTRRRDTLREWRNNLSKESGRMNGNPLSAWNALNAVTEWADHQRPVQGKKERVQANVYGASAKFKEKAFRMALVTQ